MKTLLLSALILIIFLPELCADELYGFRVNGQGRFPDSVPVTEWGPDKNVVWKTPMPSWSNASPVLCGDRHSVKFRTAIRQASQYVRN